MHIKPSFSPVSCIPAHSRELKACNAGQEQCANFDMSWNSKLHQQKSMAALFRSLLLHDGTKGRAKGNYSSQYLQFTSENMENILVDHPLMQESTS